MPYEVSTKTTASKSDNEWTFPSAREDDARDRPALVYKEPSGREYLRYQRLKQRLSEEIAEHIEESGGMMDMDELRDAVEENEDLDIDPDDDDELEQIRWSLASSGWLPSEELTDAFLDLAVDLTVNCKNFHTRDEDDQLVAIKWNDDGQLREMFGIEPHEARKELIDTFGSNPKEREGSKYDYLGQIMEESEPTEDEKKPSGG